GGSKSYTHSCECGCQLSHCAHLSDLNGEPQTNQPRFAGTLQPGQHVQCRNPASPPRPPPADRFSGKKSRQAPGALPAFMRSYFRRTQLFMSQKMWGDQNSTMTAACSPDRADHG